MMSHITTTHIPKYFKLFLVMDICIMAPNHYKYMEIVTNMGDKLALLLDSYYIF